MKNKEINLNELENLNIEQIQENSENEYFICKICLGNVFDPKMCENCENLFCAHCLENLYKNNKICPCCRHYLNSIKISRFAHSILENIKIKCPLECGLIFPYSQVKNHSNYCSKRPIIFQCTKCFEEIIFYKNNFYNIAKHLVQCFDVYESITDFNLIKNEEQKNIGNLIKKREHEIEFIILLDKLKDLLIRIKK